MTTTIVHGARLVGAAEQGEMLDEPDGWILLREGTIAATGTGSSWRDFASAPGVEVVDAAALAGTGALLTPGFIDIHVHGGGGAAFDGITDEAGADAARRAVDLHTQHGTTRAVLSLVAAPLDDLVARVRSVAALVGEIPGVLGSHAEGPFLAPARRGAHDASHLLTPTPPAVDALIEAGAGTLVQITIAPELPGAMPAIRRFVDAGTTVAIGHTTADTAIAAEAFAAGATILTHAFNAMPGLHHRDPGPVGAALADPRTTLELIADGVHVHPELIRILFAAAPGRVALVTDSMAAAGHGDGKYTLGDAAVTVRDGVARLADRTIAGSTLTQDRALRTALTAGVSLVDAVRALTAAPARAVGRPDLGSFAVAARADAVVLDRHGAVRAVWRDGVRYR